MSRRKQRFPSHLASTNTEDNSRISNRVRSLNPEQPVADKTDLKAEEGISVQNFVPSSTNFSEMESVSKDSQSVNISHYSSEKDSTVADVDKSAIDVDVSSDIMDISSPPAMTIDLKSAPPSPSEEKEIKGGCPRDFSNETSPVEVSFAKAPDVLNLLQSNSYLSQSNLCHVLNVPYEKEGDSQGRNFVIVSDDGSNLSYSQDSAETFVCPICRMLFQSKISFESHIVVHCKQEVGSPLLEEEDETCQPLDLSCSRRPSSFASSHNFCHEMPTQSSTWPLTAPPNGFPPSAGTPLEEEENVVNEAREHEKAFFDNAQNEIFLTKDSTGLEALPPLPLVDLGGITKGIKVCSDEGSPMVYNIKVHAEQIFASRILGVNEETGDKIELYKCYMCSVSFPSVSRLQVHLWQHRQRFVCSKCNYSCDSRVQFSQHVQKEHLYQENRERRFGNELMEDCSNAENTVTVAALLSALREKTLENQTHLSLESKIGQSEDTEDISHSHQSPERLSSPPSADLSENTEGENAGGDLFKMYTCRFCKKKFDRAFSCNRHERVHTGYKPCFCRICGRGFSEPRNLRHHVIRFHSDGSLRHLIKRDRRKKKGEYSPPLGSETPKEVLKENINKGFCPSPEELTSPQDYRHLSPLCIDIKLPDSAKLEEISLQEDIKPPCEYIPNAINLTKIFTSALNNSSRRRKNDLAFNLSSKMFGGTRLLSENKPLLQNVQNGSLDILEPGEIRFDRKTKIVEEDGARRIIINDDTSDSGMEHSPQFSTYAPRLNIIQEPINRNKALTPITDDIGRTFYECPYCHKLFGSTSDLNRHLDFHEDLRPYNCEYCDYSARTNSQLKVHKMRHEGIKQFSCDICNYNGVTQSDLNRHKKTQSHISRSQNICSFCGLGFYSHSQKEVHVVQCHPEVDKASQQSNPDPIPSLELEKALLKTERHVSVPTASSSFKLKHVYDVPPSPISSLPVS